MSGCTFYTGVGGLYVSREVFWTRLHFSQAIFKHTEGTLSSARALGINICQGIQRTSHVTVVPFDTSSERHSPVLGTGGDNYFIRAALGFKVFLDTVVMDFYKEQAKTLSMCSIALRLNMDIQTLCRGTGIE